MYKKRPCLWLAAALLSSFAGFLFMILAPGEISNKSATLTISGISYGFVNSMELYRQIWLLLALYLALAIAAGHDGAEPRRQLLALSFMLASVAAVFVLSFAGYAEGRSACFGCIMAIAAVGTLFPAVYRSRFKPALCFAVSLGLVVTLYWGAVGLQDICESCAQQERNRQLILSARESGAGSVSLEPVYFATKYSAGHGLTYLTANSSDWVNSSMARYYGIDSICLNN